MGEVVSRFDHRHSMPCPFGGCPSQGRERLHAASRQLSTCASRSASRSMMASGSTSTGTCWLIGTSECGTSTARMPRARAPEMSSKGRSPTKTHRAGSERRQRPWPAGMPLDAAWCGRFQRCRQRRRAGAGTISVEHILVPLAGPDGVRQHADSDVATAKLREQLRRVGVGVRVRLPEVAKRPDRGLVVPNAGGGEQFGQCRRLLVDARRRQISSPAEINAAATRSTLSGATTRA